MSISGVSSSSSSWNTSTAVQGRIQGKGHHHKAPELSKDDLTQMEAQMKKDGKDTTNIDKMISNFDTLDSSKDGKISMSELKSGADALGIKLPDGPPPGGQGGPGGPGGPGGAGGAQQAWGPPPNFQMNQSDSDSDSDSSSSSSTSSTSASDRFKAMLENMLSQFSSSNPAGSDSTTGTTTSVSA
jgi:hypothetical protein